MNKRFDKEFRNPPSAFRGAPFWAWNCKLDEGMMTRQVEYFKEMGLGGFHMHVRTGLDTPYMSEEYLRIIKAVVEKARKEHLYAWLYDEDRWPSGAAGGLVTKDPQYRARYLYFTPHRQTGPIPPKGRLGSSMGYLRQQGNGKYLASYEVVIENGVMTSYRRLADEDAAAEQGGRIWYVYEEIMENSGWFNDQAYLDTLNPKAVQRFIEETHEKYYQTVGDEFGRTVPAIFTDEPQFAHKTTLGFAEEEKVCCLPYTDDFDESYRSQYGEEFLDTLPEVIWELPEGRVSTARYHYHDHVAQRFTEAFADTLGDWCEAHHLMLTGHMMQEPTLSSQTRALGEAMRSYRGFQQPGIDILCDRREFSTAKQAQSAVHQYGRKGMTSELYGVTGWDYDFRGHKLQGDWQAALGVTLRVQHLSWASMAGEAKRDYPASIFYQSPWYKEYPYVEDHFARVNMALTSGKPVVRIGVIHPVESMWLAWGPQEQTAATKQQLEENFENTINWLLLGQMDFDFICESLLPELDPEQHGRKFRVGEMAYDVVLVPGCTTLRRSTLERLAAFRRSGGRVIFMGNAASYVDAVPSDEVQKLARRCEQIPFNRTTLLGTLEDVRELDIRTADGSRAGHFLYQMREERDGRWIFIAQAFNPVKRDVPGHEDLVIAIPGAHHVEIYDTLKGTHAPAIYEVRGGRTLVRATLWDHDSLLLRVTAPTDKKPAVLAPERKWIRVQKPFDAMKVTLSEPNALLLDQAEYSMDGGEWSAPEEVLRIDNILRTGLNWPLKVEAFAQPWTREKKPAEHTLALRYTIESRIEADDVILAVENPEDLQITWNGRKVAYKDLGYYVDSSIRKVRLGKVKCGLNTLQLEMPYKVETNVEWAYLLGDFGVETAGNHAWIIEPVRELRFGDWTCQGLPFYGGNVTYEFELEGNGGECLIECSKYRNPLLKVSVDGGEARVLAYAPYRVSLGVLSEGTHLIRITAFGNRTNSFGPIHLSDETETWIGPRAWRTSGEAWAYEYQLKRTGVLSAPELFMSAEGGRGGGEAPDKPASRSSGRMSLVE
ncbi:MAG: hypothetical protein IJM90_00855 [Firmicutes bacterium]|nr:hypothetical protein [Bacillota bacterium]